MNQWIDFNLPWIVQLDPEVLPFPHDAISDRLKQVFGQTKEGAETKMVEALYPLQEYEVDEFLYDQQIPGYDEAWGEERITLLDTFLQQHPETGLYPECQALLTYRRFRQQLRDWEEQQPEVLEWNRAWYETDVARQEKAKLLSFCGAGLNLPGTLIEFEQEGKLVQYLIGDINALGGECDDCRGLTNETIIQRYMVVYQHPEQNHE